MNTSATSSLQSLVTAAILDALATAKQNDFAGAMTRLAVAPAMLAETEFREQLLALHRALNPAFDSGPQAAAGDFQRCCTLIDAIGLPEVSASLAIERDLSFRFASIQAGDPGSALKYYNSAIARAEQLRLACPEARPSASRRHRS
jgi:hypothetical protein